MKLTCQSDKELEYLDFNSFIRSAQELYGVLFEII